MKRSGYTLELLIVFSLCCHALTCSDPEDNSPDSTTPTLTETVPQTATVVVTPTPTIPITPTPTYSFISDTITFTKTFGGPKSDYSASIHQLIDGCYILAGSTASFGESQSEMFLMKLDKYGQQIWLKTFGRESDDYVTEMIVTTDGGYILAGSTITGNGRCIYIVRTDHNGIILWEKTFGDENYHYCSLAIRETRDGRFFIAGSYYTVGPMCYLCLIDGNGDLVWQNQDCFNAVYGPPMSVLETDNGDFLVLGYLPWVMRVDNAGNLLWAKRYFEQQPATTYSMIYRHDLNVLIAGYVGSNVTDRVPFLLTIDTDGNELNFHQFNTENRIDFSAINTSADGGYILTGGQLHAGSPYYDVSLLKLDGAGNIEWERAIGDSDVDQGHYLEQTNDWGYIICGKSQQTYNSSPDVYLIKTDRNGYIFNP